MRFVNPVDTAYAANGDLTNPNSYVFGGVLGGDPLAGVNTGDTPDSLLLVSDFADPDANAPLNAANQLLSRFTLDHVVPTGADPSQFADDQYQLIVNNPTFDVYDPVNDEFNAFTGGVSVEGGLVTFSASSTTAVPEPTSLAVLSLGAIAWAARRKRRRLNLADGG